MIQKQLITKNTEISDSSEKIRLVRGRAGRLTPETSFCIFKSSPICLIHQSTNAKELRGLCCCLFKQAQPKISRLTFTLTLLICLPMVSKELNNWLWDIVCSGVPHNWILYWKYCGWMLEEYWKESCTCDTYSLKCNNWCRLIFIPMATGDDCCTLIIWPTYKAHTFWILKLMFTRFLLMSCCWISFCGPF